MNDIVKQSAAEKAKLLVDRFIPLVNDEYRKEKGFLLSVSIGAETRKRYAKQCALIAVDEILNDKHECGCEQSIVMDGHYQTYHTYWSEVKRHIEVL